MIRVWNENQYMARTTTAARIRNVAPARGNNASNPHPLSQPMDDFNASGMPSRKMPCAISNAISIVDMPIIQTQTPAGTRAGFVSGRMGAM